MFYTSLNVCPTQYPLWKGGGYFITLLIWDDLWPHLVKRLKEVTMSVWSPDLQRSVFLLCLLEISHWHVKYSMPDNDERPCGVGTICRSWGHPNSQVSRTPNKPWSANINGATQTNLISDIGKAPETFSWLTYRLLYILLPLWSCV